MIKIFLSHKKEDELLAKGIALYLIVEGIDNYCDVLDDHIDEAAEDLADYFRTKLSECTHLMALVSKKTVGSWWVPFEIGIATEREYPISTYFIESCATPDYLKKWPFLRSTSDLKKYIEIAKSTQESILIEGLAKVASAKRGIYSRQFHSRLKTALGQ